MQKARMFLIMLTCALLMLACGGYFPRIPKSIKNSFTYCYDGRYSGIDTLINIDGYYEEMFIEETSQWIAKDFFKVTPIYYIDTFYHRFMFYDNGMFVYHILDFYYDAQKKKRVKKDVSLLLKDIAENSEIHCAKNFYGNYWGGYIISGDTIKMQKMYKGRSLNSGWHLRENWYKIIDKSTILCINSFNLPTTEISQPVQRTRYPVIFIPIPTKPPPDKSWILKEKWFWCNEEEWKAHVEKFNKNNKRKKK